MYSIRIVYIIHLYAYLQPIRTNQNELSKLYRAPILILISSCILYNV